MSHSRLRVVLDTNTLLRGFISKSSAAAEVRRAAERRLFVPLLSKAVLDENRSVLADPILAGRFPEVTPTVVEVAIRRIQFVSDYVRDPKVRFRYPRDPRDEKFIELAIALNASQIVTDDKDLLSLVTARNDSGRRFRQRLPNVEVLSAATFLRKYGSELIAETAS